MKTPDEIKRGAELCANGVDEGFCMSVCPYRGGAYGLRCIEAVAKDCLTYIRQLEARVAEYEKPNKPLTIDEMVAEYGQTVPLGIDCSYVVEFREDGYMTRCLIDRMGQVVVAAWNCEAIDLLFERDYGKTWRCWPRRPTDEEREAAKWDE